MSIFDKFKANPYISTYAGAPIGEFNQVAGTLQQRMLQNTAKKNQIELALADVQTSGLDEEFKEKKIAEYQKALQEIAEAPEYATQKVMSLAHRRDMDEDFRLMSKNAAAQQAIEAKMEELDVSDPQRRKYQALIDAYQEADEDGNTGAAAGRKFGNLNLYEEQVIGDLVEDRVDGIKAVKSGDATVLANGTIRTANDEYISAERVAQSALGVLSDPKVMRQVSDEQQTYAPDMSVQDYFLSRYVNGAIQKHAVSSTIYDLKGGRKDLGANARNIEAPPVAVMDTSAFVQERLAGVENGRDFLKVGSETNKRLNDGNYDYNTANDVLADVNMQQQLATVFDEMLASEGAGLSDYEQEAARMLFDNDELFDFIDEDPDDLYQSTIAGVYYTEGDNALRTNYTRNQDMNGRVAQALRGVREDLTDDQIEESAKNVRRYLNGSWLQTDMNDLIKKGASKIATDAKSMIVTPGIMKDVQLDNFDDMMQTAVQEFSQSELVGAIQVQNDEGMFEAMPEGELRGRDLSKLKVTGLAIAGKPGAVTVSIPGVGNEAADLKTYTLNLNESNSDMATVVANAFYEAATKGGKNTPKYLDVARQFGQQQLLRQGSMAINKPNSQDKIALANTPALSTYATALGAGELYLIQNPATGYYYVEDLDGRNVIKTEVANRDRALALTIKAAEQALTQGPARQNKTIEPR